VKSNTRTINAVLLISLLAVLVLPLYVVSYLTPAFTEFIIADTEKRLINVAMRMANELLDEEATISASSITPLFLKELEHLRTAVNLPKIKVFTLDGTIIYSTDPADIGQKSRKSFFPDIVATGNAHSYIATKESKFGSEAPIRRQILETYVPIVNVEVMDVVGVFEIYYDVTDTLGAIDRLTTRAYIVLLVIVLVLLGAVFVSVAKARARIRAHGAAEGEIRRQKQLLEEQNRELAALHEEAHQLSLHDHLTGLGNRRLLEIHLDRALALALRYGHHLSCIMVDVDHFKRYNDTHGHQAGDDILATVGAIIRSHLRDVDSAFRYGGEEFLVLLPEIDLEAVLHVAEKLRRAVAEFTEVTISLGVAAYHDGQPGDQMIKAADAALYEAKRQGRNRVVCAEQTVPAVAAPSEG
jgi:diguanylate cyclase (GGDEF)-like protein